jgi:ribosomal protein S18 acetylase RimI-like enzyme
MEISETYRTPAADPKLTVSDANPEDISEIIRITGGAFSISRYFRGPQVSGTLAARRYENWVSSSFLNPSHRVLKGTNDDNEIVDFFIIRVDSGVATWLLTAISDKFRSAGLAKQLWGFMIEESSRLGASVIKTTISSDNVKAVGLYPKLGFRFTESSWVLHRVW